MAALVTVTDEPDGIDRLSSLPSVLLPICFSFLSLREVLSTAAISSRLGRQLASDHMKRAVWSTFDSVDVIRIEKPLSREEFVWQHWGSEEYTPAVWKAQPCDYQWAVCTYKREVRMGQ